MKTVLSILITFLFMFIGILSLTMFILGPGDQIITYLWLLPAQIILQPAYTQLRTLANRRLGIGEKSEDEKPEDEQ